MIFSNFSLAEARGAILAHTQRLPGRTIKKGHRLEAEDLVDLAAAGLHAVMAAKLEAEDLGEDQAAHEVACALAGGGLSCSEPRTGRCNLIAEAPGVLIVDAVRINALNAVDEAVTVATLRPFAVVTPGEVIATVKIIPFAVAQERIREALDEVRIDAPLALRPFQPYRVGLICTRVAGGRESLLDKAQKALLHRLKSLGTKIEVELRCAHDREAVAEAIGVLLDQGCTLITIAGAAATVDRQDVVPAGIVSAGGEVTHFGLPVEPGNLLVLGRVGEVPVIGMPGCARSIKNNGFDWVLCRLMARLKVSPSDIMGMGVGGLLDKKADRAMRLESQVREDAARQLVTTRPAIAGIVLAAGRSQDMGKVNKLLLETDGKTMVAHVVDAALASHATPVIVVTGHDHTAVRDALAGRDVMIVRVSENEEGMNSSLKHGLLALNVEIDGAVICHGDMKGVKSQHINQLITAFDPLADAAICVATHRGKRGNPVLFAGQFFAEINALKSDMGARPLLSRYGNLVQEVEIDDHAVSLDISRQ